MSAQTEITVRLGFFFGVLFAMATWEAIYPRRKLTARKGPRWGSNLGLAVLNMALTRLVLPITAVGAALVAEFRQWGLLQLVTWSTWVEMALAIAALDLAIYFQHVVFHAVPVLWRLHQVHHVDLDFDVSTGVRFHTLEILLSAFLKLALVFAIGPTATAVIAFEVLLNATAMFNHSNVQMPTWLDRGLRWLVVTPDMHRVHHSVEKCETNSNFGFSVPWWDYLMGTYRSQPAAGHEQMSIGVPYLRDELRVDRLPAMLILPFHARPGLESSMGAEATVPSPQNDWSAVRRSG